VSPNEATPCLDRFALRILVFRAGRNFFPSSLGACSQAKLRSIFPRGFSAAEEAHAWKIQPASSYEGYMYSPANFNLARNKIRNKIINLTPINNEQALKPKRVISP